VYYVFTLYTMYLVLYPTHHKLWSCRDP